jgi:hypothetical protein
VDPVVLIQLAEPRSHAVDDMVRICTAALRRGECRLASEGSGSNGTVAVVSWSKDDYAYAIIEVGVSAAGGVRWTERHVQFQHIDAMVERWKVVGLTIATLVGDLEENRSDSSVGSAAPPAKSARSMMPTNPSLADTAGDQALTEAAESQQNTSENARTDKRSELPSAVERHRPADPGSVTLVKGFVLPRTAKDRSAQAHHVSVAAGSLFAPSHPRIGGWLRSSFRVVRPAFVTVAISYSVRPRDEYGVLSSWASASAGAGVLGTFPGSLLQAGARVEVLLERVTAAVVAVPSGERDSRSRFVPGARTHNLCVCGSLRTKWQVSHTLAWH